MKLLENKGFMLQACPESTSKRVQNRRFYHVFTMQNQRQSFYTVKTNTKPNCLQETMVIVSFLVFEG